jgi:hypothetical protein
MISTSAQSSSANLGDQPGDDRVGAQQVVGQQQLGFVVDALEQEGHGGGERVALGHQQQAVELAVLVAGELELGDVAASRPGSSRLVAGRRRG